MSISLSELNSSRPSLSSFIAYHIMVRISCLSGYIPEIWKKLKCGLKISSVNKEGTPVPLHIDSAYFYLFSLDFEFSSTSRTFSKASVVFGLLWPYVFPGLLPLLLKYLFSHKRTHSAYYPFPLHFPCSLPTLLVPLLLILLPFPSLL